MYGFYITRLTLCSKIVEPSEIKFEKGLNIIYGGSDIGKTFIYQCIDYMLGGNEKPKQIKEGKLYQKCELEIVSYNDENNYILERNLNGGDFTLNGKTLYLSNNNHKNTISNFLLDLANMRNKLIRIDKYGNTKKLYVQHLKKYCLVDEDNILIKKSSITGSKDEEQNILKFLITQKDDSHIKSVSSDSKIKNQKAEIIIHQKTIKKIQEEINELKNIEEALPLFHEVDDANSLSIKIQSYQSRLQSLTQEIIRDKLFCLECGEELICQNPQCKNKNVKRIEELENKELEIKKIQEGIQNNLIEVKKIEDDRVGDKNLLRIELLEENKSKLKKRIEKIKKDINENQKKEITDTIIKSTTLSPITKIMLKILKEMKFENIEKVSFDTKKSDFMIDGKIRELYGQGYRAIVYSTFIIALLEYLVDKESEIGFIMIDSPLNPYKARDKKNINLADTFYRYLDTNSNIKNRQAIIFENTKPPKDFESNVRELGTGFLKAVPKDLMSSFDCRKQTKQSTFS